MRRKTSIFFAAILVFAAAGFVEPHFFAVPTSRADPPNYDPFPWINTFYFNNLKDGYSFSQQDDYYIADHFDYSSAKTWRYYDQMMAHNSHMETFPFTTLAYIAPWITNSLQDFLDLHPEYSQSQQESVYLHYKCDVIHGGINIPGCNLTDPATGACSGAPATGCSASTATALSQSRVPDPNPDYQELGWHVPNFTSTLYKDFGVWYVPQVLFAYGSQHVTDGIFWENIFYNSGLVHIDKTIEYWGYADSYPDHPYNLDYHAYYTNVTSRVETAMGRTFDWFGNFNNMFWLHFNLPWVLQNLHMGTPEGWVSPFNWGERTMPSWGIDCNYMKEAWDDSVIDGLKLAPYCYNIPFGGAYPDPDQRTKIFSIAKFYLVSNPNLYYGYKEDDIGNNIAATQWNAMANINIGSPKVNPAGVRDFEGGTNTNKFFDWNHQTTQLSCSTSDWDNEVFARHFDNGLIIARWKGMRWDGGGDPPQGPQYNSYVDPRSYSLANPYGTQYYVVQSNGTLSQSPVVSIVLSTNEGAELLQVCPFGDVTATCGCYGVVRNPGDVCIENAQPVLDPIGDQVMNEGEIFELVAHATDADCPDGGCMMFAWANGGTPGSFASLHNNGNGTASIKFMPGYDKAGVHQFSLVVSDNGDPPLRDVSVFSVTVKNVDQAPVLVPIGDKVIHEQDVFAFDVVATDNDLGDHLAISASPLPAGSAFVDHGDRTGTFSWTPTSEQANAYSLTFTVSDGELADAEDITITVLDGIADCIPLWRCTEWSACRDSLRIRSCTDTNICGTDTGRPDEVRSCDSTPPGTTSDLGVM